MKPVIQVYMIYFGIAAAGTYLNNSVVAAILETQGDT